jgi:hypothetical protein
MALLYAAQEMLIINGISFGVCGPENIKVWCGADNCLKQAFFTSDRIIVANIIAEYYWKLNI